MQNIAIVGGGLSAYLLAYRLRGYGYKLTVYEDASNVGGNCHTCQVSVQEGTSASYARFADLAVNDFNAPMYKDVVDIMDALGVQYAPLEDTASFYKMDGSGFGYTLDGGFGTAAPDEFEHLYSVFAARAWDVMYGANVSTYGTMTVGDFLSHETPFASSADFQNNCVLARVNAMYFCADGGPAQMPIQNAYFYYLLQEGFGTSEHASPNGPVPMVNRQYFQAGAQSFFAALRAEAQRTGVTILSGAPVTAVRPGVEGGAPPAVTQGGNTLTYDAIVMACHADDANNVLPAQYDQGVLGGMLEGVHYTDSVGYAHLDDSLLPAPELRRTYNVWIRGPGEPNNYSMTYVINQHQADRENTTQKLFDCPQYYVSLNPKTKPKNILYDSSRKGDAVWSFRHNVGDLSLHASQGKLWGTGGTAALQGKNGIYFIGGWTVGAGLMIECWESVQNLVNLWEGRAAHATFDPSRGPKLAAPSYLRKLRPPAAGVSLSRGNARRR